MTKEEKVAQLQDMGYEVEIENGIIVVLVEDYEQELKEIVKLFKDYKQSFGIRAKNIVPEEEVLENDEEPTTVESEV